MKRSLFFLLPLGMWLSSCAQSHFRVQQIEGSRTEMDSTWDAQADLSMTALVNSYQVQLESKMSVRIGEAAQFMEKGYPQSLLTNLTADVMRQYGIDQMGGADFTVVNVNGHRSSLNKGVITVGNLYEIYSFDNILVLLELDGKSVLELFRYYASNGGEGLSSGVQLRVKNREITSLQIGGKEVDETKIYRVMTLDYLAGGNDGMTALKKATKNINSGLTLRDLMIGYVKACTEKQQKVNSVLDDRIVIN